MEEETASCADALDVDDSDLGVSPAPSSRFLSPRTDAAPHPPGRPSGPSPRQRIPGPASAVQDAMRLRAAGVTSPVPGRADPQAADADFLLNPWLCALGFLGKDHAWEQPGIGAIKADQELDRAPLVVGVVTSCKPNGLGDLFLTLKDPSDTISASVHRKVLSERNVAQDLLVGCVVLLRKVAIFRPSRTSYLNVTKGKLVKVIRRDCEPPSKQDISSSTTGSQLSAAKCKETEWAAHLGDNPLESSEGTTSIFSEMIFRTKGSQVAEVLSDSGASNVVRGSTLGLDKSKTVPSYSTTQLSLNTYDSKNPANWQQRRGESLPMFQRHEAEGSTNNIMMRLLGREKMMPSSREMTVAKVPRDHHRTLDSSFSSSAHTSSCGTDGHPQRNYNISNTCSQPIPGGSSVTPRDRHCTQASDNEKMRLPFTDELMLPSSKKLKTDALPDRYEHGTESNMDIDVLDIAEEFCGDNASTIKPHEHQDFCAANAGGVQPTKEASATNAAANSGSLVSNPKTMVSVASVAGWTDEQLCELFADY